MTAARLVIWRHGQTDWNIIHRFQGQADVPINELGQRQALAAAAVLATFEPAALVSSDLTRTLQTAQALADLTGLEIQQDKRLREIHVGSWEGLTWDQIREVDPEPAAALWRGEDVRRSATGESVAEVADRAAPALAEIGEAAADGSTVVVTTHGLAGRVAVCRLVGLPAEHWRALGSLDNCSWTVVEWHRGGGYWRIAEYNVTAPVPVSGAVS